MTTLLFISLLFCSISMWAPADPADMCKTLQKNIASAREQQKNNLALSNTLKQTCSCDHQGHAQSKQILSAAQNDGRS